MNDLAQIFNQLDANSKQDVLDVLEYPNAEEFQLTPPEGQDNDESSLGEQTTNDSIEIEIEDVPAEAMRTLDKGRVRWTNY